MTTNKDIPLPNVAGTHDILRRYRACWNRPKYNYLNPLYRDTPVFSLNDLLDILDTLTARSRENMRMIVSRWWVGWLARVVQPTLNPRCIYITPVEALELAVVVLRQRSVAAANRKNWPPKPFEEQLRIVSRSLNHNFTSNYPELLEGGETSITALKHGLVADNMNYRHEMRDTLFGAAPDRGKVEI